MALPDGVTELGEFQGDRGPKGDTGTFASVSVTMLAAGATPTWAISGPQDARVLELGIPRGATGTQGIQGIQGPAGTITQVTVSILAAGATPTVTPGGTAAQRTIALGIPATPGEKGDKGDKGDPGDATTPATTTARGVVELATVTETTTGTDAERATTPAGVKAAVDAAKPGAASTSAAGLARLATLAEAVAQTATDRVVTPASLAGFQMLVKRSRAVFIGSSNVQGAADRWPNILCALRGWTGSNHAIGGGAYTSGSFLQQAQAAAAALTASERAEVGHVFVADASNDARSIMPYQNMLDAAKAVYLYVRQQFPNARLVVLPMIWPSDTVKYATSGAQASDVVRWNASALRMAEAQQLALSEYARALFVDHSWTWLTGRDAYMQAANDVHPGPYGHAVIANYMDRALDGETILPEVAWQEVTALTNYALGNRGRPLSVMRRGWDVTIEGSIHRPSSNYPSDPANVATVPYGFRPTYPVLVDGLRFDPATQARAGKAEAEVEVSGNVLLHVTPATSARGLAVSSRYRIG